MTPEHYRVLSAMRDGEPHTLWPMMRRLFLRQQWIAPETYAVTRRGRAALESYEGEIKQQAARSPVDPIKPQFGKRGASSGR